MIPKRILNANPNDDNQGVELNSVDIYASDFVNSQEYNRLFTGALASGLFSTLPNNKKFSRGAIILDGMEYVDLGSNQVEIKSGYFASSDFEVVYFAGNTFDISTNKIVNIRRSDTPTTENRVFGDQQPKPFAVKYTAVVNQTDSSVGTSTFSVEYNFKNLETGDSVCENRNTIKGVLLSDYLLGIKSYEAKTGVLDPDHTEEAAGRGSIRTRYSADGHSIEVDLICQLKPDNDSNNGGDGYYKIADLPEGFWRDRRMSIGGSLADFTAPVAISRFVTSTNFDIINAVVIINPSGEVILNRYQNGSFPAIVADSFINTSFTINYRSSVNGEMRNDRQWKRFES